MRTRSKAEKRDFSVVLEAAAALFILFAPVLINGAADSWGLYAVFIAVSACFAVRLIENGALHITANISVGALLCGCALLAFAWAESVFSHIRYVFMLVTAVEAMFLAADYADIGKEKGLDVRLNIMMIFSAEICALRNLIAWGFSRHFSLAEPFSAGLGQNDLLGLYMLAGLCCVAAFCAENTGKRLRLSALGIPILFVLIMSRSTLALFLGFTVAAVCVFRCGRRLLSLPFFAAAAAALVFLAASAFGEPSAPFTDAIKVVTHYPAGLGGGGFAARQAQLQSVYYPAAKLGGGASLISSLGLFGLAAALFFIGREVFLCFKYKSRLCGLVAVFGIGAFFVPIEDCPAALILLLCAAVYGECGLGLARKIRMPKPAAAALCCVLAAAAVYGCVLGAGDIFRASGTKRMFSDGRLAAERFSSAAALNPFDGESCYLASAALRTLYEEEGRKEDAVNAEYYIKRAIERDGENALYHSEYARLLAASGDFEAAAAEDETAVSLAPLNDDCKLLMAEHLFGALEGCEKGSVEARRYYQRITECAENIENLETKKEINDLADKAQPYTRIEFYSDTDNAETEAEGE